MKESTSQATLKISYLNQRVADGALNVIGSFVEWKLHTRTTCPNEHNFNVCHAHQIQRLGGYASGTLEFEENPNQFLGAILKKNCSIQVSAVSISLIFLCFNPRN